MPEGPLFLQDLAGLWSAPPPDPYEFYGLTGTAAWVYDGAAWKKGVGVWVFDGTAWKALRYPDPPTGTASDASFCTEPAATSEDPNYKVNGSFTPNPGTFEAELNVEKNGVMQTPVVLSINYSTTLYSFTVCTFTDAEGDTGTATARFYLRTKHEVSGWSGAGAWSNLVTVAYLACGRAV